MKQLFTQISILMISSLLIAGCSGGIEESSVDDKTISIQLVNNAGEIISKIEAGTPGRLLATLENAGGKPLANETISFETTLGYIQPGTATAVTDSEGQASVGLLTGAVPGTGQATATYDKYSSSLSFETKGDMDINLTVSLANKETGAATDKISTTSPGRLAATLTYGTEKTPMPDQIVTFTTTPGTIHPKDGIALTDKDGRTSVDLLAGSEPGPGEASAVFDEYTAIQKFTIQDFSLSLYLVNKETWNSEEPATWETINTIQGDSPEYLIAVLKYTGGDPVADKVIQFTSTLGGILPVLGSVTPGNTLPQEGTALTDKDGMAVIYLTAGAAPGAGKVTATFGEDYSADIGFTTVGNQNIYISLQLLDNEGNETREISDDVTGRLLATLRYGTGIPIANEMIQFSTSKGNIQSTATALTDSGGQASVILKAGSDPGAGEAKATFGEYSATWDFYTIGNQKDTNLKLELLDNEEKPTSIVSAETPGILTATLTDASENPKPDAEIFFSASSGVIDPQSAVTDKEGKATVFLSAGTKSGSGKATATYGEQTASVAFFTAEDQEEDIELLIQFSNNSENTVSASNPGHIQAVLQYAGGTPISNKILTFTTTLGILYPEAGTALTDISGMATIDLLAGYEEGPGVVTALFSDPELGEASNSLSFETMGDQPVDVNFSLRLLDGAGEQTNEISAANPGKLLATLTDMNAAPIPDQEVTFNTSLGKIVPASGTVLTDSKGEAWVQLLAGSEPGDGRAWAQPRDSRYGGKTAFAEFSSMGDENEIKISVQLLDKDGKETDRISTDSPGKVAATFTYADGTPVSNASVSFGINPGLANFGPSDTVLTDENGEAEVFLSAGNEAGVGVVTASYEDKSASVIVYIDAVQKEVQITVQLFNNAGELTDTVSADSPGKLTATLTDESGAFIPNKTVTFFANLGEIRPESGIAVTDSAGQASVNLLPGSVAGKGKAEATYWDSVYGKKTASVEFTSAGDKRDVKISVRMLDKDGKETDRISGDSPGKLVATLTYADGTPVPDESVRFGINPALADIAPLNTAFTDENGEASVFLSGTEAGIAAVTATYEAKSASMNVYIDVVQKEIQISVQLINDAGEPVDVVSAESPGTLMATLTDGDGTPIPNKEILFFATLGEFQPESGIAVTDSAGQASVKLLAGSVAGEGTAKAVYEDPAYGEKSASVAFSSSGDIKDVKISISLLDKEGKETDTVTADSPGRLEAVFTYADGTPITNTDVSFSVSLGRLDPSGAAKTDSEGKAVVFLLAGSEPGAGEAKATFGNYSDTLDFMTQGDQPDIVILTILLIEKNIGILTNQISADSPGKLVAILKDEYGIPLSGKLIAFTATLGAIYPVSGTALTDNDGMAEVYLLAGQDPGAGVAKAVYGTDSASVNFTSLGDQPADKTISVRLVDNATGNVTSDVSANAPGRLEAVIADSAGNPVTNEMVAFDTTLGELFPIDGIALTDNKGVATVLLITGTQAGKGQATATSGDYWAALDFMCVGDKPVNVDLQLRLLDNATGYPADKINTEFPGRLEATLKDEAGNPLEYQIIIFDTTLGEVYPTNGAALTNTHGIASMVLLSGSEPGEGIATATFGESSVSFAFTSLGEGEID